MIQKIKAILEWVKSTNFLAGLTLFFASLLFFYDLFKDRFLLTERDLGPYFIPPRFFWVESIKRGDFPLWNPYQFSGHPFFANPQHALLYPLNSLFFLLPFDIAFNTIIILHFFLGGLFTYFFLKDLNIKTTGSLISALIFMLSGYLLSVHSLLNCLLSVIWTPLIMLFFRRAVNNPGFRNEILASIFIVISFLGGGVEIVYGNFLIILLMVIFSLSVTRVFLLVRSLFIVSIGFLCLSAIQLIPFLELWFHSIRGKGISYQEATVWSFAPKDILLFFLPDAYGYFLDMKRYWMTQCWLKTLYTGGLPFILSLIFFLSPHPPLSPSGERDGVRGVGRGRRFYISLILLSLFLSLGQFNSLYPLVYKYVPFFNGIRYPVKFLYIFILVLAVTAGLGFQRLMDLSREDGSKRLKNLLIFFSLGAGLLLIVLILGHQEIEHFLKGKGVDFPNFNDLSVNLFHAKRFLFYLALFFLLLRVGHEVKWKTWTGVLFVFFLVADLFGNMGFYWKEKTAEYFEKTKIQEAISGDRGHFRIFSTGKTTSMDSPVLIGNPSPLHVLKEKHLPILNLLYRLHDIWGIDVVRLKKADDLYNALAGASSISETNLIDLYGVKYVISITPLDEDPRLELMYATIEGLQGSKENLLKGNTIKLYRRKDAFPVAWLVKNHRVLDSKEILSKLMNQEFRPDQTALLEEELKPNPPNPPRFRVVPTLVRGEEGGLGKSLQGLQNKVEFVSESNNRIELRVAAREDSLLVLSDTYYPGWKAYVDGKEERIYRANYNFRAVRLGTGAHQVEFIYDPLGFKMGGVITILGIIGCGAVLRTRRRRGVLERAPESTILPVPGRAVKRRL